MKFVLSLIIFTQGFTVLNAQVVQHGLWTTNSIFEVNGIPVPAAKSEQCLTKENAKDLKSTLVKDLAKIGCASNKWIIKGAQVDIGLKCNSAGLEAEGNMKGSVTNKKYNLIGNAVGTFQGIPSQAKIILEGSWVKGCN